MSTSDLLGSWSRAEANKVRSLIKYNEMMTCHEWFDIFPQILCFSWMISGWLELLKGSFWWGFQVEYEGNQEELKYSVEMKLKAVRDRESERFENFLEQLASFFGNCGSWMRWLRSYSQAGGCWNAIAFDVEPISLKSSVNDRLEGILSLPTNLYWTLALARGFKLAS